jgi:hypothetical protein
MSTFVKVKIKGKKAIFLKDPHEHKGFIIGEQVSIDTEAILTKTKEGWADVKHMIQLGPGVTVVPQVCNPKYCLLEDADEPGPTTL